jgi:hypothetical protein
MTFIKKMLTVQTHELPIVKACQIHHPKRGGFELNGLRAENTIKGLEQNLI